MRGPPSCRSAALTRGWQLICPGQRPLRQPTLKLARCIQNGGKGGAYLRKLLSRVGRIGRRKRPARLRLPAIARQTWAERPDLQAAFDLSRKSCRHALLMWFLFHGFRETGFVVDKETRDALTPWHRPHPRVPQHGPVPITWLMREAALREGFAPADMATPDGQERVARWYFLDGIEKFDWSALLTDAQAQALMRQDSETGIPLIMRWAWDALPSLHEQFGSPRNPGFAAWLQQRGAIRWSLLADPRIGLAQGGRPHPDPARPFGVNLVGYPRGRFGIGEDVRMAARALAAADVPFTIYDISNGVQIRNEDDSLEGVISNTLPFRHTIFCTTGIDTIQAVNAIGKRAFEGQHLIGFWPWELPEFPDAWRQAYAFVDEVWASTLYTRDAYLRSSPIPVQHMPMAVSVDETAGLRRQDFGLPDDRFLFVFAYDALSHSARKNPEACLAAFDRAFARDDRSVGLVIKGIRAKDSPAWAALERRAADDHRLFLLDQSLERGALLDLYRACDCFMSLHRAEGFGRNIAEAMALGLPVMVTAHSGNLDFTQSDTAAMVPVKLCAVAAGEYPFGAGQQWAEPDVVAAAKMMQRVANDHIWRDGLANRGRQHIEAVYSPAAVGNRWLEVLRGGPM